MREEYQEMSETHSKTCTELNQVKEDLEKANESLTDKDQEIGTLRDCVQQLSGDGEDEKTAQLERVQAMLDTTRVQTELRSVIDERNQLKDQVSSQSSLIDQVWDISVQLLCSTHKLCNTDGKYVYM